MSSEAAVEYMIVEPLDSIIKVTGQTRLLLVAKCKKKKPLEQLSQVVKSTRYLFPQLDHQYNVTSHNRPFAGHGHVTCQS